MSSVNICIALKPGPLIRKKMPNNDENRWKTINNTLEKIIRRQKVPLRCTVSLWPSAPRWRSGGMMKFLAVPRQLNRFPCTYLPKFGCTVSQTCQCFVWKKSSRSREVQKLIFWKGRPWPTIFWCRYFFTMTMVMILMMNTQYCG